MRTIAEVVENIKNGTWGSDIEYQSECEKLYKLCDEILEIEKAKMERIVAEFEEMNMDYFLTIANTGSEKLDIAYGYTSDAIKKAINIVKRGGVE